MKKNILKKIKNKLWNLIISNSRKKKYYPKLYKSYWHYRSTKNSVPSSLNYYSALPNPGAGIGHQLANWIAGYWFAKQFGLQFAYSPFSSIKWESFLGFGEGEMAVADLIKNGYKKVYLPFFEEFNEDEVDLQKKIIASYSNQKVVFLAEQDQYYNEQFGVMESIKQKFHSAAARKNDQLIFNSASFNIAIHVRRGDIVVGLENQNQNLQMRWQGNDYFEKVLQKTVQNIKTDKPIAIYLFSQGSQRDFPEFGQFENLHYCLEMNAQDSFLHLTQADLIITSKSSFSYKPALLSKGIKVCPQNFWHGYPDTADWILVDEKGNFDINLLAINYYE
jgi:hypothetical protein